MDNLPKQERSFVGSLFAFKTTRLLIIAVLLLAIPLTVYIAQQQQEIRQRASETQNLLQNASFEEGSPTPTEWTCQGAVSGTCAIDTTVKHEGNRSIRVFNTGGGWGWQIAQSGIQASPNDIFCFSAWVKKGSPTGSVSLAIQETAGDYQDQSIISPSQNSTDWQRMQENVSVGPTWTLSNNSIQVYLRSGTTDTNWFDNVSLTRGSCQSPIVLPTAGSIQNPPVIRNGKEAFGVAGTAYPRNLDNIGVSWYYHWGASLNGNEPQQAHRNGSKHYVPMFRTGVSHWIRQGFAQNATACNLSNCPTNRTAVGNAIQRVLTQMRTTGNYYIIGNEPNVGGGDDSDGSSVPLFIEQFDVLVEEIKARDPQARIVGPSTLGWLQQTNGKAWMENFITEYRSRHNNQNPPIDVLNIHLYDIPHATWRNGQIAFRASSNPEQDVQLLMNDLEDFRQWSQAVGFGALPIWITEWGMIHCDGSGCAQDTDPELVNAATYIVRNLLTYFTNNQARLGLERWFLFITYESVPNRVYPIKMFVRDGVNYPDGQQPITVYGRIYKEFSDQAETNRLIPTPLRGSTPTLSESAPLLGDANGNGQVNLADFQIWLRESTGQLATKQSDFNHDNAVNEEDFQTWRQAFLRQTR